MDVKATLETKVSKSGNTYDVLVVKLTDTYEKMVFLEKAELELMKQYKSNNNKNTDLKMPDLF